MPQIFGAPHVFSIFAHIGVALYKTFTHILYHYCSTLSRALPQKHLQPYCIIFPLPKSASFRKHLHHYYITCPSLSRSVRYVHLPSHARPRVDGKAKPSVRQDYSKKHLHIYYIKYAYAHAYAHVRTRGQIRDYLSK